MNKELKQHIEQLEKRDELLIDMDGMVEAMKQVKSLLSGAKECLDKGNYHKATLRVDSAISIINKGPVLPTIITNTEVLRVTHPTTQPKDK